MHQAARPIVQTMNPAPDFFPTAGTWWGSVLSYCRDHSLACSLIGQPHIWEGKPQEEALRSWQTSPGPCAGQAQQSRASFLNSAAQPCCRKHTPMLPCDARPYILQARMGGGFCPTGTHPQLLLHSFKGIHFVHQLILHRRPCIILIREVRPRHRGRHPMWVACIRV